MNIFRQSAAYCALNHTPQGPSVCFLDDAHMVIQLMARYMRNNVAPDVTIWFKPTPRKPWALITNDPAK